MRIPLRGYAQAALGIVLLGPALGADAQTAPPKATASAPTHATRLVAEFSELETALARSIAKNDKASLRAVVDADFELVSSANLGEATPYEEFVDEALKNPHRVVSMRGLSVRDMGTLALVSFYWDEKGPSDKVRVTWTVLDAWKSGPQGWKLKTRFIGTRGNPKIRPPGYRSQGPEVDKRY